MKREMKGQDDPLQNFWDYTAGSAMCKQYYKWFLWSLILLLLEKVLQIQLIFLLLPVGFIAGSVLAFFHFFFLPSERDNCFFPAVWILQLTLSVLFSAAVWCYCPAPDRCTTFPFFPTWWIHLPVSKTGVIIEHNVTFTGFVQWLGMTTLIQLQHGCSTASRAAQQN